MVVKVFWPPLGFLFTVINCIICSMLPCFCRWNLSFFLLKLVWASTHTKCLFGSYNKEYSLSSPPPPEGWEKKILSTPLTRVRFCIIWDAVITDAWLQHTGQIRWIYLRDNRSIMLIIVSAQNIMTAVAVLCWSNKIHTGFFFFFFKEAFPQEGLLVLFNF